MSEALPLATIVHAMAGRVRLRIADRRGETAFFASLASGLLTIPGVYRVEVRPLTGSIVITHGPPLPQIAAAAQQRQLFVVDNVTSHPPRTPTLPIDPKFVTGLGLGALALWQIGGGRVLPPAMTLAWYASSLLGILANGAHDPES